MGAGSTPVQSLRADSGGGNVPDVYLVATVERGRLDGGCPHEHRQGARGIPEPAGKWFEVARSDAPFVSCAFSPDDRLATGARNGTAAVWSVAGDVAEPLITIHAYDRVVDHVVFDQEVT